jgi:uncharacterized spore protein YtfJ
VRADEVLARAGENISVRRVFGEPVERGGVTVVPVAMVLGGAGGGPTEGEQGAGAGFGVWSRGIGVYTVRDGKVRFVPAVDLTPVLIAGMVIGARLVVRLVGLRRRR